GGAGGGGGGGRGGGAGRPPVPRRRAGEPAGRPGAGATLGGGVAGPAAIGGGLPSLSVRTAARVIPPGPGRGPRPGGAHSRPLGGGNDHGRRPESHRQAPDRPGGRGGAG